MLSTIVFSLVLTLSAHNVSHVPAGHLYKAAVNDYYALKASRKKQQYRDNWLNVINNFNKIYKKYPRSVYAPKSLFNMGNLYNNLYTRSFVNGDLNNAIRVFKTLQKTYKKSTLADDALFKIAEIYRTKKGNISAALKYYRLIFIDYPHSDTAPMAKIWIAKLGGNIPTNKKQHRIKPAIIMSGIRFWSAGNYTRVVIDVSKDVVYTGHLLKHSGNGKKGKRIYVDLDGAVITSEIKPIVVKDGLVEEIRAGQFNRKTVRVVLDVGNINDYSIFNLEDPFRIIIDVRGKRTKLSHNIKNGKLSSNTTGKHTAEAKQNNLTISKIIEDYEKINHESHIATIIPVRQIQGLSIKKIVIDPGHGGHDPGAIGPEDIKEKNITLKIGKMLAGRLRSMGFHVIMTRDTDVFIPLEERTAIANMSNADLFISIHANASISRKTKGIATYFLSPTRNRNSILVAARENSTSARKLNDLQLILEDLMKTAKINESSVFAKDIQKDMVGSLRRDDYKTPNLGVRSAPFFVLMHADMPSILIETSFVTNFEEEKLLMEKRYEHAIVNGIVKGVLQYGKKIRTAQE